MSEANSYPDFYQPIEGRKPLVAEQLKVGKHIYNDLFDDIILQNMKLVSRSKDLKGRPEARMHKSIKVDEQVYYLSLKDRNTNEQETAIAGDNWRDSETIVRSLDIQRIDGVYGREYWSYRLGSDGVVRRWDGGDMWGKKQEVREMGIDRPKMLKGGENLEEISKVASANLADLIENGLPNARLEEDMGLNNQPVSPEELEGLKAFLIGASDKD